MGGRESRWDSVWQLMACAYSAGLVGCLLASPVGISSRMV